MPIYTGSCHCGRVRFEAEAEAPRALVACNCSMCAKKGSLYLPSWCVRSLRILAGEEELTAYRFHTRTATHLFCRHCGIHPFHRPRIDPSGWSVNARCLDGFDLEAWPREAFDGRNWERAVAAQED
jgi:hypothetical protein